jgi:hypothetical protein
MGCRLIHDSGQPLVAQCADAVFIFQEAAVIRTIINSLGDGYRFEIEQVEARTNPSTGCFHRGSQQAVLSQAADLTPLGLHLFAAKDAGFYGTVKVRGAIGGDAQVGTVITTLRRIPTRCTWTGPGSYNIQFLFHRTPVPDHRVFDERRQTARLLLREAKHLVDALHLGGQNEMMVNDVQYEGTYERQGLNKDEYGMFIRRWTPRKPMVPNTAPSTSAPLQMGLADMNVGGTSVGPADMNLGGNSGRKRQILANAELTVVQPKGKLPRRWNQVHSSPDFDDGLVAPGFFIRMSA